jgi:hypothetical protein
MHRPLRARGRARGIDDHREIAIANLDLGLDVGLAMQQAVELRKTRRLGGAAEIDRDQIDAARLRRSPIATRPIRPGPGTPPVAARLVTLFPSA